MFRVLVYWTLAATCESMLVDYAKVPDHLPIRRADDNDDMDEQDDVEVISIPSITTTEEEFMEVYEAYEPPVDFCAQTLIDPPDSLDAVKQPISEQNIVCFF